MRLPILTYHDLSATRSAVSASPAAFREHLHRLHAAGYRPVTLTEALACLEQPSPERGPLVALTFDDGYASAYERAFPLLMEYGWPATVFPVADYAGRGNRWPSQPAGTPCARLMGWGELRTLAEAGWEIGGHTRTHPDLRLLDDGRLRDELHGGKAALEDRLGSAVRAFAYPYGSYDRRVRAIVRTAYTAACTTRMAVASSRSDRHALERLDAWYFSRAALPRLLASPAMEPYVALCRAARGGRSRLQEAVAVPMQSKGAP
jgi:peptidoglycan/xylan/chitin deacetylase (PgdA/CDA1 family)